MKDLIVIKFGQRIKNLRKNLDFTQEELAVKSHISLKYIQNLEGKKPKTPSIVTLNKIADGFGIPLWKLVRF